MTSELPGRKPVRPPENRLPPGQRLTDGWPVLTYGSIPRIDLATWEFRIFGLVKEDTTHRRCGHCGCGYRAVLL